MPDLPRRISPRTLARTAGVLCVAIIALGTELSLCLWLLIRGVTAERR